MIRPVIDLSFEAEYTLFNCSTSIRVLSPGKYRQTIDFCSLVKDSESRAQRKDENEVFDLNTAEAHPAAPSLYSYKSPRIYICKPLIFHKCFAIFFAFVYFCFPCFYTNVSKTCFLSSIFFFSCKMNKTSAFISII